MVRKATVIEIKENPDFWNGKRVDITGWCLRAMELSNLTDTIGDAISWVPMLGARREAEEGVYVDLNPTLSQAYESGAIYLDQLWSEDLKHKWPGIPKLAKVRIIGQVLHNPVPSGHIVIGHYHPIIIKAELLEPLFDGIVECNDYWHSR